jgi:tripartite-type tricarboxylate transporter receptor subunit TctC
VQERTESLGLEIRVSTPEELARLRATEIVKWARVVKDAGARAD